MRLFLFPPSLPKLPSLKKIWGEGKQWMLQPWGAAQGALCSPSTTRRQVVLLQPLRVPSCCPQKWQGSCLGAALQLLFT